MRKQLLLIAGTVAMVLSSAAAPVAQSPEPTLPLPLRLSTWAVSMGTMATGKNAVIEINITRWTTPKERQDLIATALEKGQNALLRALTDLPSHGRFNIPGWVGADPNNLRLGWELHYAYVVPGEDGGHRILIATDRHMSFGEVRNQGRSMDYPFTLMEIRLNKNGEGEGKAAVATKITYDKKRNTIELENYGSEPVRLQQVRIRK
jgi:hypothetical protein